MTAPKKFTHDEMRQLLVETEEGMAAGMSYCNCGRSFSSTEEHRSHTADDHIAQMELSEYRDHVRVAAPIITQLLAEVEDVTKKRNGWRAAAEAAHEVFGYPEQCQRGCIGERELDQGCDCGFLQAEAALKAARELDPEPAKGQG